MTWAVALRAPSARRSSAPRSSRPIQPSRINAVSSSTLAPRLSARAEIDATVRVQTQVPHAVGCQPAAIARPAERLRRRRDDAEDGAVRQPESIRRRRRVVDEGLNGPVAARQPIEHLRRDTTSVGDQRVAPPTSMYSMNRTSAFSGLPYSTRSISSSSLTPWMTTRVDLETPNTRCAAAMPSWTRASSSNRVSATKRSAWSVSRLTVIRPRPAA